MKSSSHLPSELLILIFQYLESSQRDLWACALVCRHWNMVVDDFLYNSPRLSNFHTIQSLSTSLKQLEDSQTPRHKHNVYYINLADLHDHFRNSLVLSVKVRDLIPFCGETLEILNLGFCKGVSNYDLSKLAHHLSTLSHLNLAGGGRSDIALCKILKHCPRISHLNVSWNWKLTDSFVMELSQTKSSRIDSSSIAPLVYLDLTSCTQITDRSVTFLAETCSKLQSISLAYCRQITIHSVRELIRNCKELRHVAVQGCPDVVKTKEYRKLLKSYPHINFKEIPLWTQTIVHSPHWRLRL
jgi:hypothetical protein